MKKTIKIKPHHFIDIIRDFGLGKKDFQPHPYGHNVHIVANQILENPNLLLVMETGIDDICPPLHL